MDDDVQAQWFLGPDRIFFVSAGMPPVSWMNANSAWVMNWRAPLAAADDRRPRKRARVAATSEPILGLPEVAGDRLWGEECAICLKDFGAEEMLRAMPCSHAFHQHCISQWLHRNPSCPLCRRRLSPTDDVKEEDEEDGESEEDSEDEEDWEWEDGGVIVGESS